MKKSICISGYYGPGNYGDELMRQTLADHLPDFELHNFRPDIHTQDFEAGISERFDEAVAVIIGGGDILVPSHAVYAFWDHRLLQKPVFVYGVGVPKQCADAPQAISFYRDFLNHPNVKSIVARDPQSAEWIRSKLLLDKDVAYYPDIVWARADQRKPSPQKRLALITRSFGEHQIDYRHITALCEKALANNFSVRHIVLGIGNIREADLRESIGLPFPNRDILVRSNIQALIREIAQCSAVASMKFHGCVTAFMMGIPAISLLKHAKFQNLFEIFGIDDQCCSYADTDLPNKIEYLMDQRTASQRLTVSLRELSDLQAQSREGMAVLCAALRNEIQNG